MSTFLIIAAASYLLGSIPFGYLLVRIFRGEDVRRSGSGNIGATNVSRKSLLLGVLTLLLDAGKGAAAVVLAIMLSRGEILRWADSNVPGYTDYPWFPYPPVVAMRAAVAALFAVLGHMFPVWLKFRGGKGVATGVGAFVLLAPKAILAAIGTFLALLMLFRYVSLGSIVAVLLLPLLAWLLRDYSDVPLVLLCIAAASLLIVARHYENIRRLLAGTESRVASRRTQR
jgi:acyl phosphate:glycerol-3-phosphate acyltransferase